MLRVPHDGASVKRPVGQTPRDGRLPLREGTMGVRAPPGTQLGQRTSDRGTASMVKDPR